MQQIKITNTVYESGHPKYLGGQLYPVTEDTLRQVALNNGEEVDEPTEAELAEKAAAEAPGAEPVAAEAAPTAEPDPVPAPVAAPAPTTARKRAGG